MSAKHRKGNTAFAVFFCVVVLFVYCVLRTKTCLMSYNSAKGQTCTVLFSARATIR